MESYKHVIEQSIEQFFFKKEAYYKSKNIKDKSFFTLWQEMHQALVFTNMTDKSTLKNKILSF